MTDVVGDRATRRGRTGQALAGFIAALSGAIAFLLAPVRSVSDAPSPEVVSTHHQRKSKSSEAAHKQSAAATTQEMLTSESLTVSRWYIIIAGVVGAALALLSALDVREVVFFCVVLAAAAHGLLAIYAAQLYYVLKDPPRGDGARRLLLPPLKWLAMLGLTGFVLYRIDALILDLRTNWGWKQGYFVAVVLVFALTVLLVAKFHCPRTKRLAFMSLDVLATMAVGAVAVLVLIAVSAFYRQRDSDEDLARIDEVHTDFGTYVALGDSYSAGEGVEPFLPGLRPDCHRSLDAYPMLLVEEAFVQRPELVFTACSGAVSHDIDRGIIGGYEAQIDPEPRPEVGLVTITVGGNDVIFSRVVQLCLLYEDCLNEQFEPPEEDRSRPTVEFPPSAPFEAWARAALLGLANNLDRVYKSLSVTYPNARIIVVGYPYLFPAGSQWRWPPDCAVVLSRVDSQERAGLRQLTDRLNTLLYEHATASGLEFLSPVAAWHEHEPCGNNGQLTAAVKPAIAHLNPVDGGTFHPNRAGQRQLARLVACYLLTFPSRDDAPSFEARKPPGSLEPAIAQDRPSCSTMLARG